MLDCTAECVLANYHAYPGWTLWRLWFLDGAFSDRCEHALGDYARELPLLAAWSMYTRGPPEKPGFTSASM